jgi:hypothetical protein
MWALSGLYLVAGLVPDQRKLVYASIRNLVLGGKPLAATNAQPPADSRVAEHDNLMLPCWSKMLSEV